MWLILLSAVAATVGLAKSFPNPMECVGGCTNTHDPSLIQRKSDGTYFRFATGGRISIYTSDSLSGPWAVAGTVLPPGGSSIKIDGYNFSWAPDVHYVDDTYYLYYAVSTFGSQVSAIGVATSKTMIDGEWVDHGGVGVSSAEGDKWNAIDPNLIVVDGKKYLTFGSHENNIYQTTLSEHGLKGPKTEPYQIQFNKTKPFASEGAYVFAYGNHYYLFWSSGVCCGYDKNRPNPGDEYKIMVCRSDSVEGPYVDQAGTSCLESGGTLVLGSHGNVYGPGGQGVYDDPSIGPILYYHYVNTDIGYGDGDKLLGINVLDFSSGWPEVQP